MTTCPLFVVTPSKIVCKMTRCCKHQLFSLCGIFFFFEEDTKGVTNLFVQMRTNKHLEWFFWKGEWSKGCFLLGGRLPAKCALKKIDSRLHRESFPHDELILRKLTRKRNIHTRPVWACHSPRLTGSTCWIQKNCHFLHLDTSVLARAELLPWNAHWMSGIKQGHSMDINFLVVPLFFSCN